MGKPHKHSELIKAWADGAEIQFQDSFGNWFDCEDTPRWVDHANYRIKPEPNPDFVLIRRVDIQCPPSASFPDGYLSVGGWPNPNLKLTFDGETRQLKSAEVL